jgi:hypothetical protein
VRWIASWILLIIDLLPAFFVSGGIAVGVRGQRWELQRLVRVPPLLDLAGGDARLQMESSLLCFPVAGWVKVGSRSKEGHGRGLGGWEQIWVGHSGGLGGWCGSAVVGSRSGWVMVSRSG